MKVRKVNKIYAIVTTNEIDLYMVNGDYLWFCQFQFLVCNTSLAVEGTLVHRLQWLQHLTACFIQNGQGGLKISQTLYYWTPWTTFTKWVFDSIIPSIGCPKKNETGVFLNILNQVSDFNLFFSPENWDPYANFEYKTISVQFSGAEIF